MKNIILLVYLGIGVLVAGAQGYLGEVSSIGDIINLLLAVVLWPLLLVGVDFNLKIGDGGDKKNRSMMLGAALTYVETSVPVQTGLVDR
jgi:hypothetical protein